MRKYLEQLAAALERGHRFVTHDVWQIGKPGEQVPHGMIIKNVRVAILLVRGVMEETLLLRASALTFATMLFIVPFLTFMFFFITTFNLGEGVYQKLSNEFDVWLTQAVTFAGGEDVAPAHLDKDIARDFLEARPNAAPDLPPATTTTTAEDLAPHRLPDDAAAQMGAIKRDFADDGITPLEPDDGGAAVNEELKERILGFVLQGVGQPDAEDSPYRNPVETLVSMAEQAAGDASTLGLSGLLFVLTTVFGLMRNVESSFNAIWGVERNRNYFRVLSDYLMVTLLLPFVAAAVLGITAALESQTVANAFGPAALIGLRGMQFGVICLTMSLLNWMVPNTKVLLRYALLGGIVAGCLWVLNSWAFVKFQMGLARYTLFFSGFALFPLLMMWIYFSWIILLFGSLFTFACQNEKTFAIEQHAGEGSHAYKEALGLRLVVELARRFRDGRPGITMSEAADAWNVPMRVLTETVEALIHAGLVTKVATDPPRYQPGRSPEHVRVRDVTHVLREAGHDPSLLRQDKRYRPIYEALDKGDAKQLNATIAEVVERTEPQTPAEPRNKTVTTFPTK